MKYCSVLTLTFNYTELALLLTHFILSSQVFTVVIYK